MYVVIGGEVNLLRGPVIMVNYEDGGSICDFLGCHSGPVDGFHCRVVVCRVC